MKLSEKERASILLEAAWEAVAELGPTDCTAERFLIPAILKCDPDREYAREQLVELEAVRRAPGHGRP